MTEPHRVCTCHPDDDRPVPCAQKYALNECKIWDAALWALISTLHSHVAEDKRPAGWSDFSDEQIDRLKRSAEAFLRVLSPSSAPPAYMASEAIRWQRVNDEPFEYAIQQGPNGDEFVKLLNGSYLRRTLPGEPGADLCPNCGLPPMQWRPQ
jgi:hypothetical protein